MVLKDLVRRSHIACFVLSAKLAALLFFMQPLHTANFSRETCAFRSDGGTIEAPPPWTPLSHTIHGVWEVSGAPQTTWYRESLASLIVVEFIFSLPAVFDNYNKWRNSHANVSLLSQDLFYTHARVCDLFFENKVFMFAFFISVSGEEKCAAKPATPFVVQTRQLFSS